MSCDLVAVMLGDYASGALAEEEKDALELHLSHCPGCAERTGAYLAVIRQAASLPPPVPSAEAEQRIRDRIREALERRGTGGSPDDTTPDVKPLK